MFQKNQSVCFCRFTTTNCPIFWCFKHCFVLFLREIAEMGKKRRSSTQGAPGIKRVKKTKGTVSVFYFDLGLLVKWFFLNEPMDMKGGEVAKEFRSLTQVNLVFFKIWFGSKFFYLETKKKGTCMFTLKKKYRYSGKVCPCKRMEYRYWAKKIFFFFSFYF